VLWLNSKIFKTKQYPLPGLFLNNSNHIIIPKNLTEKTQYEFNKSIAQFNLEQEQEKSSILNKISIFR